MSRANMMFMIYNQLGTHMWKPRQPLNRHGRYVADKVLDFEANWRKRMEYARKSGANAALVDVAEMMQYPSHPEIWIDGAWSAEKMNGWVKWLKSLGYRDVIPSLNFSCAHDQWLGEYSRMISTPQYYRVCRDLLKDVYEAFDKPRFINFGMDEEDPNIKWLREITMKDAIYIVRQGELFWHDTLFFIKEIEKLGARAFMWSDKLWYGKDEFAKHIPRSVLQSNWFYGRSFDLDKIPTWMHKEVRGYSILEELGYDQVPGCSHYIHEFEAKKFRLEDNPNIGETFRYCKKTISPERLKGFHVMSWTGVTPDGDKGFYLACDMMRDAIAANYPEMRP